MRKLRGRQHLMKSLYTPEEQKRGSPIRKKLAGEARVYRQKRKQGLC